MEVVLASLDSCFLTAWGGRVSWHPHLWIYIAEVSVRSVLEFLPVAVERLCGVAYLSGYSTLKWTEDSFQSAVY